ncbi:MAG: hypothetical protein HC828_02335 [Blastochloris sp.]|nr:hypothetical protein [Blastochloris sp.]
MTPQTLLTCSYLPEPLLAFGDAGLHIDPKAGIARYGPYSYAPVRGHPKSVQVGFIGTAETIEKAHQWLEMCAQGVKGSEKHPEFPGYQGDRGFFSNLEFDDAWNEQLTQTELHTGLTQRASRARFEYMLGLLEDKLRLLALKEFPPRYIIIGLPNDVIRRCRSVRYTDKELGVVHRDLRRAFKARAMKYHIPTQFLRQPTMEGKDKDHPSKIAWNFFTGLYSKAGGIPWAPVGLEPGTCYIGIGFYRPLGSKFAMMQTSLAQAFDQHGRGLVLRGPDFEWDMKKHKGRSPHLNEQQAAALMTLVLNRYQEEIKQTPRRVVVHKTSQYWDEERTGFQSVLQERVTRYDLLALNPQTNVRLLAESMYPPLRGTHFSVGNLDFLYTTGFIAALEEFHAMHVPSPLRIADHIGQDSSRETLLQEILILTKMNWNSARLGGVLPITIKFSRLVGDILREVSDREPLPQFKFYI